tara:strand:+ start:982 stop:1599 length:618 start_codon:yes stop_codon:yes gene_type:complete
MPFLKDFIINDSTKITMWKIIPGELDEKHLNTLDIGYLETRKGKKSREYFLAVRKILKNENPELFIKYDLNGKPHLNNQKGISISHSNEIVAICISNEKDFGIDVQHKTDQVFKIQNKFLSEIESKFLAKKNDPESIIKVWSAKESIYKALGKQGVSFLNDIEIETIIDKDIFRAGYYRKGNIKIKFDLDFLCMEEYIICYAKKS